MIFYPQWFAAPAWQAAWLPLLLLLAATARPAAAAFARHRSASALAFILSAAAWSLSATTDGGALAGIGYHLLAVNLTALMIGAPAALWLGSLLMLPHLWLHTGSITAYPINTLTLLLPPLAVNLLARHWVARLPPNLFIFIFINGFLASATGMILTGAATTALLAAAGTFSDGILWQNAFPVFFLMAWAEAFLSGIAAAIFIALRPHWIATFDDERYLKRRNQIW
ncbi:energy-coupling factor ABC transporter permease [Bergeriella denitrificans]|uniref:Integral membrane protein n=1 Tax=Bergeriella denitrificans TaxID=494 RepID=A0A378UHT4_BERDE|nr:energy-coupling factor ABC transporter permease [Bergeriella denitrificans]STZ76032.1 integral membrane protein [Bergeriella denitrificans]